MTIVKKILIFLFVFESFSTNQLWNFSEVVEIKFNYFPDARTLFCLYIYRGLVIDKDKDIMKSRLIKIAFSCGLVIDYPIEISLMIDIFMNQNGCHLHCLFSKFSRKDGKFAMMSGRVIQILKQNPANSILYSFFYSQLHAQIFIFMP